MRRHRLFVAILVIAAFSFLNLVARAQSSTDIYKSIKDDPSKIRWCLSEAGDDPAGIIGRRCQVYSECLDSLGLNDSVDKRPYPTLSAEQVESVRKCHQALYNAARTNPQLKGSKATQDWLEHNVSSGTEAKAFPVPSNLGRPH
ncbi:hypothetical protein DYQ86_23330 [Acidobacteria bacterium AB60]|nr:hypothetical protein DYQ86_23330 [Acidobacteria bacterium AB60]